MQFTFTNTPNYKLLIGQTKIKKVVQLVSDQMVVF